MLYQDRTLGRPSLWTRLASRLNLRRERHAATMDLLSLSPYLQRDIGYDERAGVQWWVR